VRYRLLGLSVLSVPTTCVCTLLVYAVAAAQTSSLTVQSNLVLVPTLVQDTHGGVLYGLNASQFALKDNGVLQTVRVEDSAQASPLSLVVLLQCSRSAWREHDNLRGLATMVEAAIGNADEETAVVSFGAEPELIGGFSRNPAQTHDVVMEYKPCNDDADSIFDAVDYAAKLLETRDPSRRRAILLVSETRDHGSEAKPEAVISRLGKSNIVVDAVAFSPAKSQLLDEVKHGGPPGAKTDWTPLLVMAIEAARKNAPKEFAELSGGEYINFTTQHGFDRSLGSLANHVHNGYLLSFQPRDNAAPGLHTITVEVADYKATVRYRRSYWYGDSTMPTP
jgi:VWFA-related protein